MNNVAELLTGGELSRETLKSAQEATFVSIPKPKQQYSSYIIRTILATIIATGGIATDSTAVVVGSMIIAPLMNPMIGVALAAVLGRPKSTFRALSISAFGVAISIGISYVMSLFIPYSIDLSSNFQVTSRLSPRLVDLIIALASSFMIAIVLMRDDIPDAIAGVAIAESILPPLCVTGLCLAEGNMAGALGSFLLFLTNFFSIQLAGIATFASLGLGKSIYSENTKRERAEWYAAVFFCAVLVIIPLAMSSNNVVNNAIKERTIHTTASEWLEGTSYQLKEIRQTDGHVSLEIMGTGERPSMTLLGTKLQKAGIDVKDIRMAVVDEYWYRPDAHTKPNADVDQEYELYHSDQSGKKEFEYKLENEEKNKDTKPVLEPDTKKSDDDDLS